MNLTQKDDGTWVEATPLPAKGWKATFEKFFHNCGLNGLADLMSKWDEKGLGR